MCGILGGINFNFDNSVLDTIKHRGPDYGEIQHYEYNSNTVCFGHRRLSILDLSPSGNQPMTTPDNQLSIIFNGEILYFSSKAFDTKVFVAFGSI
jgi:asparagine synthase (glutamine-hydrolysing)